MKALKVFLAFTLLIGTLSFGQNMFPLPSGNVGIGTTTPFYPLDVQGRISAQSIYVKTLDITNDGVFNSSLNSAGVASINMGFDGAKGFVNFGAHTGSGFKNDILYLRGNDGNVGIGTTNPTAKLHVMGNITVQGHGYFGANINEGGAIALTNGLKSGPNNASQWNIFNMTGPYGNGLNFWAYGTNGYNSGPKLTLLDNGKLGVGMTQPQSKLHVGGAITLPLPGNIEASEEGISFMANHRFNYDGKYLNHYGFGFYPYSQSTDVGGVNTYMAGYYGLDFFTQDNNRMRILHNGNVGIGTKNPDEKLTVNGTIHATEVKVTATVPADYVFQKYYTGKSELKSDYVMPTLAEIETFTKKNNHLPNVPSAKEIQEKGMSLGEMNNLLLRKVEELTLYAIEQQKKLEEQNRFMEALAIRLKDLEKK